MITNSEDSYCIEYCTIRYSKLSNYICHVPVQHILFCSSSHIVLYSIPCCELYIQAIKSICTVQPFLPSAVKFLKQSCTIFTASFLYRKSHSIILYQIFYSRSLTDHYFMGLSKQYLHNHSTKTMCSVSWYQHYPVG
jgi:hypothetical protein